MFADDSLAIYLNDHLAGSAAGRDLADKIRSKNSGTPRRLPAIDIDRLIDRAQKQLEAVEQHRQEAAANALTV